MIKQLLAEVEHDIMKYQCQDLSYLPKEKAEVDNADVRFDKNLVTQIFFSIVNLLNNLQKSDTSLSSKNFENNTCAWMKGLETSQTLNFT